MHYKINDNNGFVTVKMYNVEVIGMLKTEDNGE